MKKNSWMLVCILFLFCFCLSCHQPNDNSTSIRISESHGNYEMKANFNSNKTFDIDNYMNKQIGNASNVNFQHSEINAQLT